jgi:hypothetical protein
MGIGDFNPHTMGYWPDFNSKVNGLVVWAAGLHISNGTWPIRLIY